MTVQRFIDVLNRGALVAPGVMACKDGSVPAGWQVAGRLRHPASFAFRHAAINIPTLVGREMPPFPAERRRGASSS